LQQAVFAILETNVLCSIATVNAEGRVHINTAYFSYSDDLNLYFLSHPRSLHCRNLSSNPSIAMTVFSSVQRWTDPGQGLQLFGTCEQAAGSSAAKAETLYARRFDAYAGWKDKLKGEDSARDYRFFRFRVDGLKILDEKNLGDAIFIRASVTRTNATTTS
jgi:uncharacterized protein YhbP (UPF0306 family)